MSTDTGIIIIGGGMIGATLAGLLGREQIPVTVVESQTPRTLDDSQSPLDLRVSSVNLASANLFERVGAWETMTAQRVCPFRRLWCRDQSGAETRFDARETGYDWFGWFVENAVILNGVQQSAQAMPSVRWIAPSSPSRVATNPEAVDVELETGEHLSGALVVGADGASSQVREGADISSYHTDYHLRALVVNVATELPQQDVTWQRFTSDGPQAFLPLPGHRASLVWYGPPDTIRLLESLDDDTLAQEILEAFPEDLGHITAILGRASFPIRRQHAARYTDTRLALLGDAAHAIHPLVGQGLNLGLQGVGALADVLIGASREGSDPGRPGTLAEYERKHRPRALAMMVATDTLHRVFTREDGALTRFAGGALRLADRVPVGRRSVMRYAMGLPVKGGAL